MAHKCYSILILQKTFVLEKVEAFCFRKFYLLHTTAELSGDRFHDPKGITEVVLCEEHFLAFLDSLFL